MRYLIAWGIKYLQFIWVKEHMGQFAYPHSLYIFPHPRLNLNPNRNTNLNLNHNLNPNLTPKPYAYNASALH